MSYTKLFSHIITSSVWSEDDQTRILWITLLALADKHGEVMAAVPGLAKVASLPLDATKRALERLTSPDPHSRTPDQEGRRIVKIPGGWHIINYAKHRRMASDDDRRDQAAVRMKRLRERKKRDASVTQSDASVRISDAPVTPECDKAEAEAEYRNKSTKKISEKKGSTEGERKPNSVDEVIAYALILSLSKSDGEDFWDKKQGTGWKGVKDWKAVMRSWKRHEYHPSQKVHGGNGQKESKSGGEFSDSDQHYAGYPIELFQTKKV